MTGAPLPTRLPGWAPDPVVAGLLRQGVQAYIVGGAVRDALLGLPAGDRDWVVVGATPEQMSACGFQPVGHDFPVFLHPATHEEYALARTERKSGRGYKGFVFQAGTDVSLEDDLQRRDLTINALALAGDGTLIDPHGGRDDLARGLLRHVGPAFSEDPVRLLRLARFAARFGGFQVAPDTLSLARRMVANGEVDALVPERVWREIAQGLGAAHPNRLLDVLHDTGALPRVLPHLHVTATVRAALQQAVDAALPLPGRFALLCMDSPQPEDLARRVRAPRDVADQARLLPALLTALQGEDSPPAWLDTLEHTDALRRPDRFLALLDAAACVQPVERERWRQALDAVGGIDAGAIARAAGSPQAIKAHIRAARLQALTTASHRPAPT